MKTFFHKYIALCLLFSISLILLFTACQKDPFLDAIVAPIEVENFNNNQAGQRDKIPTGEGITVLGKKRNIPYTEKFITAAMQEIYGSRITPPRATHLYVRMRAINAKQFDVLDNLDLNWEDQPIEYEVTFQGERYEDPSVSKEEMQWLYATVPADFTFSDVTYEIIERLVITPYHSHLTFKAFQLSGNEDVYEGFVNGDCTPDCLNYPHCLENGGPCLTSGGDDPIDCTLDCPNYPCCLLEEYGCDDQLCDGHDCFPGAPNWPACNEPGSGSSISCGCSFRSPSFSQPTGRVTVEDTVLDEPGSANQGVRNIKVQAKADHWFSFIWHDSTTDEEGCFKINHSFSANKIKLRLKFINDYFRIRTSQKAFYSLIYKSRTFFIDGPNYSNLCIELNRVPENEGTVIENALNGYTSYENVDWQAATVANAVAEFHDWELPLPDDQLQILINGNNDGAPMFGLAGDFGFCTDELILSDGTPMDYQELALQLGGNLFGLGVGAFIAYTPDVVLEDEEDSDDFRTTIYHELAHVSHYNLVGECYWRKVRAHETFMGIYYDDPYGDPTAAVAVQPPYVNFPIVALTESWGEHVGKLYTFRKYGALDNDYLEDIEDLGVLNNFIPEGIHWDIMDGIDITDGSSVNGSSINDSTTGATLLGLYALLNNETVVGYRNSIGPGTSATGNIFGLFSQYGY